MRVGRRKVVLVRKEYEFCHQIHQDFLSPEDTWELEVYLGSLSEGF